MPERSPATGRRFTPAAAVEGVDRRTVHIRTPGGVSLVGTLRVPPGRPLPAPAVLVSPPWRSRSNPASTRLNWPL